MKNMNVYLAWALVVVALTVTQVNSYKKYAPTSACGSMTPRGPHGGGFQSGSPFTIVVDRSNYRGGETVRVTLRSSGGRSYKGVFVQARYTGGTKAIGRFSRAGRDYWYRTCNNQPDSAVTHYGASKKTGTTFDWRAPRIALNNVEFHAVFVEDLQKAYKVKSRVVTNPSNGPVQTASGTASRSGTAGQTSSGSNGQCCPCNAGGDSDGD